MTVVVMASWSGPVGDPVFHFAVGKAAGLGRYYGEGRVQLDQFTSPSTADFSSAEPFVFTAPNGDKLAFTYGDTAHGAEQPGRVELFYVGDGQFVAVWVAEFNPFLEQCTGRFRQVLGGSFIMVAVTEPFVLGATDSVDYTWEGERWIEYGDEFIITTSYQTIRCDAPFRSIVPCAETNLCKQFAACRAFRVSCTSV